MSFCDLKLEYHRLDSDLLLRIAQNDPSLTEVTCKNRSLADLWAESLIIALETNSTVTSVNFRDTNLTNVGLASLCKALESNSSVTNFNFRGTYITATGLVPLLAFKCVRVLQLRYCNRINFTEMENALASNLYLTSIKLHGISMNNYDANSLSTVLQRNKTLKTVCAIFYENVDRNMFLHSLSTYHITTLSLKKNTITEKGANLIACALQSNCSLTNLNLKWCGLSEDSTNLIFSALVHNSTLKTLDITRCAIPNDSSLFNMLKYNSSLTRLDICYNTIKDKTATTMASALMHKQTFIHINMANSIIQTNPSIELYKALLRNPLVTIYMKSKRIDRDVYDLVHEISAPTYRMPRIEWWPKYHSGCADLHREFDNAIVDMLSVFYSNRKNQLNKKTKITLFF